MRDAKARLLADELAGLRRELADHTRAEHERHAERLVLQDQVEQLAMRIQRLEAQQRSEAVDEARGVAFALEQVQERLRGLSTLAGQRLVLLGEQEDAEAPLVSVTQGMIDDASEEVAELSAGLGDAQDAAEEATRDVVRARGELDALDADIAAQSALVSAHDMRIAALRGTADAAHSAAAAVGAALERQQRALDAALARRVEAEDALGEIDPEETGDVTSEEHALAYERAQQAATAAEAEVTGLRERLHAAERERDALTAQTAALARALDVRGGAAELVAAGERGVQSLVGDAVQVRPGYEAAIAAVLGPLAEGALVGTRADALALAERLRAGDLGAIDLVIADAPAPALEFGPLDGVLPAVEVVTAPAGVRGILASVLVADDLVAADRALRALSEPHATVTVVTRAGEVCTPQLVRAGSGTGRSRLELVAERDAAAERLAEITVVADALREALAEGSAAWESARRATKETLAALRAHDADRAAHAEQVNRLAVRLESSTAECERLEAALRQTQTALEEADDAARVAQERLEIAQEAPRPILDASARDGLLEALEIARDHEMRLRLDVETLRERIRAAQTRVATLERQREQERAAAEAAARRAVLRRAQREVAAEVHARLPLVLDSIDRSVSQAASSWRRPRPRAPR